MYLKAFIWSKSVIPFNSVFTYFIVFAVKGQEDVTIQVCDRGGGIPRKLIKTIFQYLYTTASPVLTSSHEVKVNEMMDSESLASNNFLMV